MSQVLNLGNEVVRMRADVKRVKVLVIRKLTRQISALKKKKGKEADLERNQRRAARLLEEIKELKVLAPDVITKAALQKEISFEKVCQNKEASLSERATARIATHPEFSRRIQDIKKAIEAFKAERTNKKKAKKESKSIIQQQSESEEDSDGDKDTEESEDEQDIEESGGKNGKELKGEDGSSQVVHSADTEEVIEMTKENKDLPIAAKENKDLPIAAKENKDLPIAAKENKDLPIAAKENKDLPVSAKETSSATTPLEVLRMRKEVKKLRILIIRKLTQQISSLRKTQGGESVQTGNQDGAARLQKEVQVLRGLLPDCVTRRALQGNINVEEVFQDPESSPLERAIVRITTHARFIKKLQDVKEAIEKEKSKAAQAEEKNESREDFSTVKSVEESDDDEEEDDSEDLDEEEEEEHQDESEDGASNTEENREGKEKNKPLSRTEGSNAAQPPVNTRPAPVFSSKEIPKTQVKEKYATPAKKHVKGDNVLTLPAHSKETPLRKAPPSGEDKPKTKESEHEGEEEESDLESSDGEEEKEYFDDSTEERFHKQSSLSDDSDEDDFFLGKVSKLKKKKSAAHGTEKKNEPAKTEVQHAQEVNDSSREFRMQSVFCSTLSKSSRNVQKGKAPGSKPSCFQNQKKQYDGDAKPSWFKSQDPGTDRWSSNTRPKGPGPKQMGVAGTRPGKPAFEQKQSQSNKGASGRPFKPPQQALHPSWEASRKRKEQQSQITAFQGKKIKFDDDDD